MHIAKYHMLVQWSGESGVGSQESVQRDVIKPDGAPARRAMRRQRRKHPVLSVPAQQRSLPTRPGRRRVVPRRPTDYHTDDYHQRHHALNHYTTTSHLYVCCSSSAIRF